MFQIRPATSQAEPDEQLDHVLQEQDTIKLLYSDIQQALAELQSSKASAWELTLLLERMAKQEQLAQQRATALANLETQLKSLLDSTSSNQPSTPDDITGMDGWIDLTASTPSFQLDTYKTSDAIQIADSADGIRCYTEQPTWSDIVVFRDFLLETAAGKTLDISFKIDTVDDNSYHLLGIGDINFDFSNLSNSYSKPVVAIDFSRYSIRQQHRLFGALNKARTIYGSALPTNGAQVTLRIKPGLMGGLAEVSLYQVTPDNRSITSSSFRIFHTTLPDAVVPPQCYLWWVPYGAGALWMTGVRIG